MLPIIGVVLLLCVVAAGTATGAPAPKLTAKPVVADGAPIDAPKAFTSRIAKSDPALIARTDSAPVTVMVKLDYDAVAAYRGGVAGLAATSPKKTGKKLEQNRGAVTAYTRYVERFESGAVERIKSAVSGETVRKSFQTVYGGVSMTLPASEAKNLLAVDGVVAVQKDELLQPLTDSTPTFVGATAVWPSLGGSSKAGEGVIVGILDSGVWPEHPSFADPGIDAPSGTWACEFGNGTNPDLGDPFTCNDKLIGARAFVDTYLAVIGAEDGEFCSDDDTVCSARDADGHGTHTATTAAGSPVANATLLNVPRGPVSGMAPGAHVIAYRVCLDQGCFGSDSVAAVNQALADGVDVINFSISGGSSAYTDPVELAFLDAYAGGILVNASAGNSGPGPGTANHAGPWTQTVAASTPPRSFRSTLRLTSVGGNVLDLSGVTVTEGIDPATDVVLASSLPGYSIFCGDPAPPFSFTGKVVVCERGGSNAAGVIGRAQKGYNVLQGGAAGMILYNPAVQQLNSDSHWLPALHIEGPKTGTDGPAAKLLAFLGANTGVKATWVNGVSTPDQPDVIASFSSRGPVGDFIKPDVTAPGVQILAGMTPEPLPGNIAVGPPGELYQAIAGTSMSSPHSAGVAALVKAAHPEWTPGQIKSALMTSSVQENVVKENGTTPSDPFDRGAGSIRANRAVEPTVTFDVDPADYALSASDPLNRVHLNLPSIYAPTMPGELTTWRTMTNVTDRTQSLEISTSAPSGAEILVQRSRPGRRERQRSDRQVQVGRGDSVELQITISAPTLPNGGPYFGQITLDPRRNGANTVVIPVAFVKKQGSVTLDHSCSLATFERRGTTTCAVSARNLAAVPAEAKLEVEASRGLEYTNVTPPGVRERRDRITWSGILTAGFAPPVSGIAPGGAGAPYGYFALSSLGIAPIAGIGDETIANFNVPAFEVGTESYTRIGIVANGYLVIGGGTAADVTFDPPDTLPQAERPNNVVAPYWTDLNPGAGGAVRIGVVGDGTKQWIVVEWTAVPVFGTAQLQTFQVWLETAETGEGIGLAYGPVTGTASPEGLQVAAENRDGTSAVTLGKIVGGTSSGTIPAAGQRYTVSVAPPVPGGGVSFSYQAGSRRAGTETTTATLTSNITPGETKIVVPLTVTP